MRQRGRPGSNRGHDPFPADALGQPLERLSVARPVKQALQQARAQVASLIRAQPERFFLPAVALKVSTRHFIWGPWWGGGKGMPSSPWSSMKPICVMLLTWKVRGGKSLVWAWMVRVCWIRKLSRMPYGRTRRWSRYVGQ